MAALGNSNRLKPQLAEQAWRSGSESHLCAGLGLRGFLFAILRRSGGFERAQKAYGNRCYFINRGKERGFIGLRRFVEAGDFADKLKRGGAHFFVGDWRIEVEESFDVSAHESLRGGAGGGGYL